MTFMPDYLSELGPGFTCEFGNWGSVDTHSFGSSWGGHSYPNASVGDYIQLAVDLSTGQVWFKFSSAATWAGGGDPALGTSPTLTFTVSEPMVPAVGFGGAGGVTMNYGATAFAGAVPTGFTAWA